jgi:MFS family permease
MYVTLPRLGLVVEPYRCYGSITRPKGSPVTASTQDPSPSPGRPAPPATDRERPRTLLVAALGTTLALVSYTLPMSVLVSVGGALHAGPDGQTWMLAAMSVGLAAGMLACGVLGDEHGRRRVFLTGTSVLAVTSLAGAASPDGVVFALARVGQGLGAAAMIACGLGLIGHAFGEPAARARATGIWGAALGGGIAVGPMVAALFAGHWRLPYLLVAALAVALVVAGRALLTESRGGQPHGVDVPGVLLLGGGLAALLAGLVSGRTGWTHPATVLLLALGVLGLAGFVLVQRRVAAPLLDLRLLRAPDFAAVTIAAVATGAGIISSTSFLPIIVERGFGDGVLLASLVLLTWSGVSVPVALLARRLRLGGDVQLMLGLLVVAAGQLALYGADSFSRLLPGLVVSGVGSGMLNAALGRQAVASVPAGRAGMGSGANNTARFLGAGIGVTVIAVVATRPGLPGLLAGWNQALLVSAGFSVLGALGVLGCVRAARSGTR